MKAFLIISAVVLLIAAIAAPTVMGLYLAFKASLILGIVIFIVEPSPMVIGFLAIFGHADLCQKIVNWLHLPF